MAQQKGHYFALFSHGFATPTSFESSIHRKGWSITLTAGGSQMLSLDNHNRPSCITFCGRPRQLIMRNDDYKHPILCTFCAPMSLYNYRIHDLNQGVPCLISGELNCHLQLLPPPICSSFVFTVWAINVQNAVINFHQDYQYGIQEVKLAKTFISSDLATKSRSVNNDRARSFKVILYIKIFTNKVFC